MIKNSSSLPNILFILVDAMRSDALSCYGPEGIETPHMDRLAKEGVLFTDAFSCTNVTESSLTSIFSGMYPSQHGIRNQGPRITKEEQEQARSVRFLPEILGEAGYQTMAVDWLGRWHRRGYDEYAGPLSHNHSSLLKQGASTLIERLGLRHIANRLSLFNKIWVTGLFSRGLQLYNAEGVVNRIVHMLDTRQQKPFFIFAHFWDLHAPYAPPPQLIKSAAGLHPKDKPMSEVLKEIPNSDWHQFIRSWANKYKFAEEVADLYHTEARFTDAHLGRLWQELDRRNLTDETLIILTSDHGESLLEHNIYFDHHGLYDVSVHVPLLMRYPAALPRGQRITGLVQHVDLLPTILELIGKNGLALPGHTSLLNAMTTGVAKHHPLVFLEESQTVRRLALRTEHYKYIYAPEPNLECRYCGIVHGEREELYDLQADPKELRNIAKEQPELCSSFSKKIDAEWPSLSADQTAALQEVAGEAQADYDAADQQVVEQRLKDLGYM